MKALITGGAGFIGSNLVDALLARGDDVVVIDSLATGRKSNLDSALGRGARLVVEDIRDGALVASLLARERPEVVFHFAAQMDVRVSTARPVYDAEVNVIGTINMLEAARQAGVRRLVFTSTGGAIYGETDVLPTPEDAEINSEAPYGQAKYSADGDQIAGWASTDFTHGFVGVFAQQNGLVGKFSVGGFDLTSTVLDGIGNGSVDWTIGQNPYAQGWITSALIYMQAVYKYPAYNYDTGSELVTKENLQAVLTREKVWQDRRGEAGFTS